MAWLRYGEIKSDESECKAWDAKAFEAALPAIRKLTRKKDLNGFAAELKRLCADCGVALVIARAPAGCRASGATRFLSSKKAMMLLSFRYLSDDQFWFSFFHEAGHLLLHNQRALFLEDGSEVTSTEEKEANAFAADILVPPALRSELYNMSMSKTGIMRFAVKAGICRGIVVGQLQHMKLIKPSQFNWLKRRLFSPETI